MRRRTMLVGAAAAAGAALMGKGVLLAAPKRCCERDHDGDGNCDRHPAKVNVLFTLTLPGPYEKLPEQLQEGVEGLEEQWPDMEVTQSVSFELYDRDGNEWLMSSDWGGDARTLITKPDNIFKDRRWHVVKWAVDLRRHHYWRDEVKPTQEPVPPEMSLSNPTAEQKALLKRNWDAWLAWHKEQCFQLGSVVVEWMGSVTPHPEDRELAEHAAIDPDMKIFVKHKLTGFKRT